MNKFIKLDESISESSLEARVKDYFKKYSSPVAEDEVAICMPSHGLRQSNTINIFDKFKHVYLFVMPDEVTAYQVAFPWATVIGRKSTCVGACRNEIIEYVRGHGYKFFMICDDDMKFREYYYPVNEPPKTRNVVNSQAVHDYILKNVSVLDSLKADLMYFESGGFTDTKMQARLKLQFGGVGFQAWMFRTKLFDNEQLRYTPDPRMPEDDCFNELVKYFKVNYIKAMDIYNGDGRMTVKEMEAENSSTTVDYTTHADLWARTKSYRESLKHISQKEALLSYGYPNLK